MAFVVNPTIMTPVQEIAFLEAHEDETFALARQLADCISHENEVELNALRMMPLLKPIMKDKERIDRLEDIMTYSGGGAGGTYSFTTPLDVECGMLRAAIDACEPRAST